MKTLSARPRVSRLQTFAAALALCVAGGHAAHATVFSWDPGQTGTTGGGGAGNWDLTSNFWNNNTTGTNQPWPDNNTSTNVDTAVFGGTAGTVTTTAAIGVNTIQFNTSGYNVNNGTGGTTTLIGANPTIFCNFAATGSAQVGGTLLGGLGFTKTGAGTLNISSTGTITLGATGAIINTAGTTNISSSVNLGTAGVITPTAGAIVFNTTTTISGGTAGNTVINGTAGNVTFNSNNTYAGVTNVGTGFFNVNGAFPNAFGATGTGNGTTVANGGTVRFQNTSNVTVNEAFTISGAGASNGALQFYNATGGVLAGAVTLAGDSAITLRSNLATKSNTISGGISEATAGGTSSVLFSRFNASTTGTAAEADSYVLSTTASTYGGNTFITDAAGATGGNGTGTTTATNYFFVQSNLNNALPTTTVLTLGGQQTVQGQNIGTAAGAGRFVLNGVNQTVAGLTTAGTAGALNIVSGGSATTLSTLTVNNPTTAYTFSGVLGATTTGGNNLALVKAGASSLTLSGTNTYTGGTTITGGTLIAASASALGTGNVTLGAATNLTINAGVVITNMTGTTLTLNDPATSTVNLLGTGVQDTVAALVIAGINQLPGTYGSATSGAQFILPDFAGTGQLLVAVPEPSTWAMLGLGAVGLGFALRRRRA